MRGAHRVPRPIKPNLLAARKVGTGFRTSRQNTQASNSQQKCEAVLRPAVRPREGAQEKWDPVFRRQRPIKPTKGAQEKQPPVFRRQRPIKPSFLIIARCCSWAFARGASRLSRSLVGRLSPRPPGKTYSGPLPCRVDASGGGTRSRRNSEPEKNQKGLIQPDDIFVVEPPDPTA